MYVLPIGLLNWYDSLTDDMIQMIDLKLFSYLYMEKPIFGRVFIHWVVAHITHQCFSDMLEQNRQITFTV